MGLIPILKVDTPCGCTYTVLDPTVPPLPPLPPCPDDALKTEPNNTRQLLQGPPNGVGPNAEPLIEIGVTWGPPITGMDADGGIAIVGRATVITIEGIPLPLATNCICDVNSGGVASFHLSCSFCKYSFFCSNSLVRLSVAPIWSCAADN